MYKLCTSQGYYEEITEGKWGMSIGL